MSNTSGRICVVFQHSLLSVDTAGINIFHTLESLTQIYEKRIMEIYVKRHKGDLCQKA